MKLSTLFPPCSKPETFGLRPSVFHLLGSACTCQQGAAPLCGIPSGLCRSGAWDNFPLAGTTVRLALLSSSRLGAQELCLPSEGA